MYTILLKQTNTKTAISKRMRNKLYVICSFFIVAEIAVQIQCECKSCTADEVDSLQSPPHTIYTNNHCSGCCLREPAVTSHSRWWRKLQWFSCTTEFGRAQYLHWVLAYPQVYSKYRKSRISGRTEGLEIFLSFAIGLEPKSQRKKPSDTCIWDWR